jgi:hypothetical protein
MGVGEVLDYIKREKDDPNFNSGRGWYGKDIEEMESITTSLFPEAKDPATMGLFKALAAVLSPSARPRENYRSAAEGFSTFLSTGKFPAEAPTRVTAEGKPAKLGINADAGVARLNSLIDSFGGDRAAAVDYLTTVHEQTREGHKNAYGAADLGPKVGNFFLNLMGLSTEVTVDLWATRTWNRWQNTLFRNRDKGQPRLQDAPTDSDRAAIQKAFSEIASEVSAKTGEQLTPMEVQAILWFYEKDLYEKSGASVDRGLFAAAAKDYAKNPLHLSEGPVKLSDKTKAPSDDKQKSLF